MSNQPNYLKMSRIKTPLSQKEVGFLIGLSDSTSLSRIEKGQRQANIEILLQFHFLYDMSIESFYEPQSEPVQVCLVERIRILIKKIKANNNTGKNNPKINFLEELINRLSNIKNDQKINTN